MRRVATTTAACALGAACCIADKPTSDPDPNASDHGVADVRRTTPAVDAGTTGPDAADARRPPGPTVCMAQALEGTSGACVVKDDPEWGFDEVDVHLVVEEVGAGPAPDGCGDGFERTMPADGDGPWLRGIDEGGDTWTLAMRAPDWAPPFVVGERVRVISSANQAFETERARVAVLRGDILAALFVGGDHTDGFEPWPGWRVEPGPVLCGDDPEEAGDFCERRMRDAEVMVDGDTATLPTNGRARVAQYALAGGLMDIIDHGACNFWPQRPVRLSAVTAELPPPDLD